MQVTTVFAILTLAQTIAFTLSIKFMFCAAEGWRKLYYMTKEHNERMVFDLYNTIEPVAPPAHEDVKN